MTLESQEVYSKKMRNFSQYADPYLERIVIIFVNIGVEEYRAHVRDRFLQVYEKIQFGPSPNRG